MRIRWRLLASALTCTVLFAAYQNEATSARASSGGAKESEMAGVSDTANVTGAQTLKPGDFRFSTGVDKQPQHIHGPVTCDTRDDTYRIRIGDPDAGGLEIGLSLDGANLKYVDLGNRGGVYFALFNDSDDPLGDGGDQRPAEGAVRRAGETYLVSGRATGMSANHHVTQLYFDISVACP